MIWGGVLGKVLSNAENFGFNSLSVAIKLLAS
jgi:hypothetical protein